MADPKNILFAEDPLLAEKAAQIAASKKDIGPGFDRVHFAKDEVIFEENDMGDAAYLIVRGNVEIRKSVRSKTPKVLGYLGRGDVFGELALFDNSPRMAEAWAKSNVEAICISRKEFLARLDSTDDVMKAIVLHMVKRVRSTSDSLLEQDDPDWNKWNKK